MKMETRSILKKMAVEAHTKWGVQVVKDKKFFAKVSQLSENRLSNGCLWEHRKRLKKMIIEHHSGSLRPHEYIKSLYDKVKAIQSEINEIVDYLEITQS